MNQTEVSELYTMYISKTALTIETINIFFNGWKLSHFIILPALIMGNLNALAVRAIHETLGTNTTNNAIFGVNNCTFV